jgi:hypothetical protein
VHCAGVVVFGRTTYSDAGLTVTNPMYKFQVCRRAGRLSSARFRTAFSGMSQLAVGTEKQSVQSATALEPNQTRFLTIFPAPSMDNMICCGLMRFLLMTKLFPLSRYCRIPGVANCLCPLKIITNLFDAMRHLRSKNKKRTTLIDAICINNMAERSRQVLYIHTWERSIRLFARWSYGLVRKNTMVLQVYQFYLKI